MLKSPFQRLSRSLSSVALLALLQACGGGGGGGGVTSGSPPGAPTGLAGTAGNASVTLSFTAPAGAVNFYTATCVPTSGASVSSQNASTQITVAGLTNETTYNCSVTASNNAGTGPASSSVSLRPTSGLTALTLTPILGGLGAGATCEAFRADTGAVLNASLTNAAGLCVLNLPRSYGGIVVLRVKGGPGVKYFDERTNALVDFPATALIASVIPQAVWSSGATAGTTVSTLTTIIAAQAGITLSATATSFAAPSITSAGLAATVTQVLQVFGFTDADFNPFAPLPAAAYFGVADVGTNKQLAGSPVQLKFAVALVAVAKLAPAGTDLGTFAGTIANAVKNNTLAETVPTFNNFQTIYVNTGNSVVAPGNTVPPPPTPPATIPGAPTGLSVVASSGQLTVSFSAPASNGGSPIELYTATCTPTSGSAVSATASASPIVVKGLTNGTTYSCRVVAKNAVGAGPPSAAVSGTPVADASPPVTVSGAPTGLVLTAGNGSISVAFTAPSDNGGATITSFTATCTPTSGSAVSATASASPIVVSGLTNGVEYSCTVLATNSKGAGPVSAAAKATPAALVTVSGAPTGLVLTAGNGSISVAFTAPSDNGGATITSFTATCT
ncbi:MAG: fibronectin type III domain-containing protein, partial [Gammaproteobacteria bacterium]|nr:fibronectin type III domain-containing protein [Gammaproteobacteria bacterium]